MSLKANIIRGRSHFIFIAALLLGSAFIFWSESRDPDSWGQQRLNEFQAGAQPRIVASVPSEGEARYLCGTVRAEGGSCQIILPSKE